MADRNPWQLQLFVRLLDGKSAALTFPYPQAYGHQIKRRIFELTKIPTDLQRLICGGYQISDFGKVSLQEATVNLVLSLRGGKGGFGSLLRGAATKAGQKKTNNFDACRDMSGRRLRHVNAEKKLEEWKAEEEERKLEKLAQEFLKKQAKKGKGKQGTGDREAQKYVEKYREESAKCIEAVEMALEESFQNGKRKGKMDAKSEKSKRLKIWMGKRIMGDSDGDCSSDEEDEKPVGLDNGSKVASDKDTEGSSGSVTGVTQVEDSSSRDSCENGSSEGEKESYLGQNSDIPMAGNINVEAEIVKDKVDDELVEVSTGSEDQTEKQDGLNGGEECKNTLEVPCQPSKTSSLTKDEAIKEATDLVPKDADSGNDEKPLNFDDFSSATDMEVLGMERLKTELQARGLKCGGTLKERAGRLYMLKSTPLDKIPKKLIAKK